MATHHGKEGVVTVGGTEMGEVTLPCLTKIKGVTHGDQPHFNFSH